MRARQQLLTLCLAALLATGLADGAALARSHGSGRQPRRTGTHHGTKQGSASLPENAMESALQIKGSKINGDLSFSVERTDINNVTLHGVPIKPSFQINGEIDFQPLGGGRALMNGDLALKPGELNPVISAIIRNGLTFQAEHQHMYDFEPMVWFVHLRGRGDAVRLSRAVHNVIKQTSTPLPQSPPAHPSTPLDAGKLKRILHGYDAEVGQDGVVTVYIARRSPIDIDGVKVNPATNIATNVSFEPLDSSGTRTAAVPDFGMVASEVGRVVAAMQSQGWDIGCLYNQETDEHPQLYFSHQFKTGDPYQLAHEIRKGLDQMNSQ